MFPSLLSGRRGRLRISESNYRGVREREREMALMAFPKMNQQLRRRDHRSQSEEQANYFYGRFFSE